MKHLLSAAMVLGCLVSNATAIDCTRARKPSELAICRDPQVRSYDLDMSGSYEKLRGRITAPERRLVQIAQQQWINRRNAACGADSSCLLRYCQDRTAVLDRSGWEHVPAVAAPPPAPRPDTFEEPIRAAPAPTLRKPSINPLATAICARQCDDFYKPQVDQLESGTSGLPPDVAAGAVLPAINQWQECIEGCAARYGLP
jgi:uncharacterized protein YecT (DUF1311 family)